MILDWRNRLMLGFIATVFVACLFGPYMISVMLGTLGLMCYLFSRNMRPDQPHMDMARHAQRARRMAPE